MADGPRSTPCQQSEYWKRRFESMRETYRQRYNEGLDMQAWHAKHCAAFVASKEMQRKIAAVVADIETDVHHVIAAEDIARRLRPLLPRGPEEAPACSHDHRGAASGDPGA